MPDQQRQLVLAVEDNETHRYALTRILESEGFAVIATESGKDALALARQNRPAVILLDVNLSGENGYDLCRTLKSAVETKDIPVVIYTSYEEAGGFEASAAGATSFLTYPVHPSDLLHVIRGAIAKGLLSKN